MQFSNLGAVLRRQWLVVAAVMLVGAVLFFVAAPILKKYTATSTVLAVSAPAQQSSVLDPSKDPSTAAVTPADLQTLVGSQTVLGRVSRDLDLDAAQASKLGGEIKAKSGGSDVIPITATVKDPRMAVKIVNAATAELVTYDKEIATSRYDQLIHDLTRQAEAKRAALRSLDDRIERLSTNDIYVAPDTGTTSINARLISLETQRDAIQASMYGNQAAAKLAEQRPKLAADLARREITQNDPTFVALHAQYGKDLAQLDFEKAGYTDAYPGLSGLKKMVSSEHGSLTSAEAAASSNRGLSPTYVAAELDANKQSQSLATDQAQLKAVNDQIVALWTHLNDSHGEAASIGALRRDRAAGEADYSTLSNNLAKATSDRAQAATIDSLVVIDRATSASQSALSKPAVLGSAIAIAFLWLAISLAFMLDGADARLRTTESIEELYGSPVVTSVG